jgi:RNA polymerase sigma factor (TIGR02999 family)
LDRSILVATESGDANSIDAALRAVQRGDRQAAEQLLPLVYDELRALARSRLAKLPPNQTLQPTALVHEAYVRVVGEHDPGWQSPGHFFAAAAQAMRNILVDRARRKAAVKHGGGRKRIDLDALDVSFDTASPDILALHEVLTRLEREDPRRAQIVNLRFFAGLTAEQTATAMNLSLGTVEREWRGIKNWLAERLVDDPPPQATGP